MKKTVIITGASRGIGKKTAEVFASEGYSVIINYKKCEREAQELCKNLIDKGHSAKAIRADISRADDAESLIRFALDNFGSIDVIVNNSGVSKCGLFHEMTNEEINEILSVNLGGALNCTKAALPHMIRKKSGSIINISSIWGLVGASCEVVYSASKAAIIGFTKALAKEVGPSGIRVNCVAPGVINTDMNCSFEKEEIKELEDATPLCRIGTPWDIAQAVLFLASEKSSFITGQIISPNGGFVI